MKTPIALFGFVSVLCSSVFAVAATAQSAPPAARPASSSAVAGVLADRSCKIIETLPVRYPLSMEADGVTRGEVSLILHVNAAGELVDHLITSYTRRPFADEVLRVLPKWKYEPGIVGGKAIDTLVSITVNFEVTGVLVVQRYPAAEDTVFTHEMTGFAYQACSLKKLDRLPTPVNVVSPTYPQEWADQGIAGVVPVNFYIDETGKARMAVVTAPVNPLLAGIAIAAVERWTFTPPTCRGLPVLVHARQVFSFGATGNAGVAARP